MALHIGRSTWWDGGVTGAFGGIDASSREFGAGHDETTRTVRTATLHSLTPQEFRSRLPELVALYVAAMRYPEGVHSARISLWDEHSRRPGFACRMAADPTGAACGVAYGYRGMPGQWWYSEVSRGLGDRSSRWLTDFFELTELHVRPDTQGGGIGESMLIGLLAGRPESIVLLSTPEGSNRAWRLYRRMGFQDVLRDYRFTGDPRPFGVLGRALPLPVPAGTERTGPAEQLR